MSVSFFEDAGSGTPPVLLLHGLGGCSESWRVVINGQKGEDMPFIASNGLTETGTSKTIAAGGMNVHYHDVGEGEPVHAKAADPEIGLSLLDQAL